MNCRVERCTVIRAVITGLPSIFVSVVGVLRGNELYANCTRNHFLVYFLVIHLKDTYYLPARIHATLIVNKDIITQLLLIILLFNL